MEIQDLNNLISTAQRGYDYYIQIFQNLLDTYLLKFDTKTKKSLQARGKSSLYIPIINSKVKRVVNSFQEAYFQNDEFCKISSLMGMHPQIAEAIQKATDHYINYTIPLYRELQQVFIYITILGSAVVRSYWSGDKPVVEFVALKDIRFDPSARVFEDCRFVVHDIYLTKEEIAGLIKKKYFKADINIIEPNISQQNNTQYARIKLQDVYYVQDGDWYVSTIYNQNIILRDGYKLTDGLPFNFGILQTQIETQDEPNAVLLYGDPIISASISLQNEANIRRNQQIDAISRLLNPKVILGQNSGINPLDLLHPTKAVQAQNVQDINVIPAPNMQSSVFDLQDIRNDISENTGISPQQNGMSQMRNLTATESNILSNEGNMRLQSYIRSMNETLIEPLMTRLAKLVWKYGDASFFAGIDRSMRFEFITKVNTGLGATNKEVQTQGITQAMSAVMQLAQLAGTAQDIGTIKECINAQKYLVRNLLPMYGIADVDNYFKPKGVDNELGNGRETQASNGGTDGIQPISSMGVDGGQTQEPQGLPLSNSNIG